jgi:hypothetical protein
MHGFGLQGAGPGESYPGVGFDKPQRAPRPNKKFLMPEQPGAMISSVTVATTEQIRVFIVISFICIASVFVDLAYETAKNYGAGDDVQTQR